MKKIHDNKTSQLSYDSQNSHMTHKKHKFWLTAIGIILKFVNFWTLLKQMKYIAETALYLLET